MPVYSNNIPQPNDDPSQSQNEILQNFQVLDTAFAQDHGAYNSAIQGQHMQITFPVTPQSGQPFTYLAGQIGLQNLNQAPTERPDIWLARGTAAAYPMTGYMIGGTSAQNGWTYLPSGILMAWGIATVGSAGTFTVTLATLLLDFPGFTTQSGPPIVTANNANNIYVSASSLTTFNVVTSAAMTFSWFVMGL